MTSRPSRTRSGRSSTFGRTREEKTQVHARIAHLPPDMSSFRAVSRAYATAATASIAPPIQLHGLSGKYAGALYSAALKKSAATLKQVEADVAGVKAAIKVEPKIQEFLANPVLSSRARSAGIDELLKLASPKAPASEVTKNFFEVLAENGRLYDSEKVIEDFLEIMSAHRGEVKVTITTAQPLEKDLQSRLEATLKQSLVAGAGKTLIIQNKVNEAVLGGLVIDFADKTIDLSVASRVNKLNAALQQPI